MTHVMVQKFNPQVPIPAVQGGEGGMEISIPLPVCGIHRRFHASAWLSQFHTLDVINKYFFYLDSLVNQQ